MDIHTHLDGHEVGAALVCHGLGHQRLAAAGRAIQQHARGGRQAQRLEALRVHDGLCDAEGQLLPHLRPRMCTYVQGVER